jgi:hypothetical protein
VLENHDRLERDRGRERERERERERGYVTCMHAIDVSSV